MTDEAPTDTIAIARPRPVYPKPLRDRDAGRAARRQVPIRCYVGGNGHGKSLSAVHDLLPSLREGRKVFSTVVLTNPETGEPWPNFELLEDFEQILDGRHYDVLLDEVIGIASSRESSGMDPKVAAYLNQLRRRDVTLSWTAPAWARADKIIRECTQAVTLCEGMMAVDAGHREGESNVRLWRERRLFNWRTFSALDFDEWTSSKGQQRRPDKSAWFWRPNSHAMHAYDTLGAVSRVSAYGFENGHCVICQGSRPRMTCKGHKGEGL